MALVQLMVGLLPTIMVAGAVILNFGLTPIVTAGESKVELSGMVPLIMSRTLLEAKKFASIVQVAL